jgi:hypothetical protein
VQITQDQYYLFMVPDDSMCPVWCETFTADGGHYVGPMPVDSMDDAAASLRRLYPGATVDELCMPLDIANAREWARTMPLEQIPAR